MEIEFELNKSEFEGVEYYGSVTLSSGMDDIKIKCTVRKGDKGLFICLPSKKSTKDDKFYSDVFMSEDLYKEVNDKLNKKFNKKTK